MKKIINNFDLAECFLGEKGICETTFNGMFDYWMAGKEEKIDSLFAELSWLTLLGCIEYFCEIENENFNFYETEELNLQNCLALIQDHLDRICKEPTGPYEFHSYIMDFEKKSGKSLNFSNQQIMAAYTIYCIDQSITCLLTENTKDSAKFALYVGVSFSVAQCYDESDQIKNNRKAAVARYKNDPKQKAKKFIKECWDKWQKSPENYRKQSDFANDCLMKIELDANGGPI